MLWCAFGMSYRTTAFHVLDTILQRIYHRVVPPPFACKVPGIQVRSTYGGQTIRDQLGRHKSRQ